MILVMALTVKGSSIFNLETGQFCYLDKAREVALNLTNDNH